MPFNNRFFDDIFREVNAYVMRDFSNLQSQTNDEGKRKFCLFTFQSIFNIIVDNLVNKEKYSGEICIPKTIICGSFSINRSDIIQANKDYKKGKLLLTNEQSLIYDIRYKRTNEQIEKINELRKNNEKIRITIFPLDGASSFFYNFADFSIAIVVEKAVNNEEQEQGFTVESIFVNNPVSHNTYSFSKDGATLNGTKITDDVAKEKVINAIYVNDCINKCHFDITKIASKVPFFATSTSIFLTICNIAVNRNFIAIYSNEDEEKKKYVDFMIKNAYLASRKIGNHLILGKAETLAKIVK